MRNEKIQNVLSAALLVAVTSLVACSDDESVSEIRTDSTVFSDGPQLLNLLSTGAAATSENFWFCTFLNDGAYVNRLPMYLWENGTGSLDGTELTWTNDDDGASLQSANFDYELTDIEFSSRSSISDRFSASYGETESMVCDLAGPPKFQVLNDDVGANNAFFLNGGTETLDVLLNTGDDQFSENFWRCQATIASGAVEEFTIRFSDRFAFRDDEAFDWDDVSEDAIEIELSATETEFWSGVSFRNLLNPRLGLGFSASRNDDGAIDCEWGGENRASRL